jgi:hypothetical protein
MISLLEETEKKFIWVAWVVIVHLQDGVLLGGIGTKPRLFQTLPPHLRMLYFINILRSLTRSGGGKGVTRSSNNVIHRPTYTI